MGIKNFDKLDFVYFNYVPREKFDLHPIIVSIGKLPRINKKLPKISNLLPDMKLLV